MKFRCERDVLLDALITAGRAVATRGGAMPVLSGVRMEATGGELRVVGTDLDLTIQVVTEVSVSSPGVVVAPGKLLADIVRALDSGAVLVESDDEEDELRISSGRSNFSVRTHPAADFPRLPPVAGTAVNLPVAGLTEALRQVVRAASSEDSRPILTGVLMAAEPTGLRLVATDSYRLAVRDLPGAGVLRDDQRVLIPSRALAELQRLLSSAAKAAGKGDIGADATPEGEDAPAGQDGPAITLRLGDHDATFEVGQVKLTTRLIEGDFPNYRALIPSNYPNNLTVGREALLDAIRRVKLMARDGTTPVRIAMRSDGIELTVQTQDWGHGSEEVDAKYEGAEMVVAFNPQYLSDGVEAITSDEVRLETLDALKPATLRPTEGSDYLYLLMPVRVS